MLENKYEKCFAHIRGFEVVKQEHLKSHEKREDVVLPLRGTKYSAGYDFFLPYDVTLNPNEQKIVWTDIKTYMQNREFLSIHIRSSIGIKKGVILSNITGVVDMDYFENPSNDGNIGLSLKNISDKTVSLERGERVAQGIFLDYLVSDNCNGDNERIGGIGSTNER